LESNDINLERLGVLDTSTRTRVPPKIIALIIKIQKKAILSGGAKKGREIVEEVERITGRKISYNSVVRVLSEEGLSLKHQKVDPRLTALLNKFWSTYGTGIGAQFAGKTKEEVTSFIINFVDKHTKNIKNPDEKYMIKNYFIQNIPDVAKKLQLRDVLQNKANIPRSTPYWNQITNSQIKNIHNLIQQGYQPVEISRNLKIPQKIINDISQRYQMRNFKFDPNHPSMFLADRG